MVFFFLFLARLRYFVFPAVFRVFPFLPNSKNFKALDKFLFMWYTMVWIVYQTIPKHGEGNEKVREA